MKDARGPSLGRHLASHPGCLAAGGMGWFGGIMLLASAPMNLAANRPLEAGLGVLGGALFLAVPVLRWRQRLDVYEHGLVWHGLFGTRRVLREHVTSATFTRHLSRHHRRDEVKLDLAPGDSASGEVTWVGLERPAELCEMLRLWATGVSARPAAAPAYATNEKGVWVPPSELS